MGRGLLLTLFSFLPHLLLQTLKLPLLFSPQLLLKALEPFLSQLFL